MIASSFFIRMGNGEIIGSIMREMSTYALAIAAIRLEIRSIVIINRVISIRIPSCYPTSRGNYSSIQVPSNFQNTGVSEYSSNDFLGYDPDTRVPE